MAKRKGTYTVVFDEPISVRASAAVGSKKESEGPIGHAFDVINEDDYFGEKTWEKAESRMQQTAIQTALDKAKYQPSDIDCVFAGDLMNQCVGSTYGLRSFGIPFVGLAGRSHVPRRISVRLNGSSACRLNTAASARRPRNGPRPPQVRLSLKKAIHRRLSMRLRSAPLRISESRTPTTWGRPWLRLRPQRSSDFSTIPAQDQMITTL